MSSSRELASTFSPAEIESPLYEKWMSAGYFTADANSTYTNIDTNHAILSDDLANSTFLITTNQYRGHFCPEP